MLKQGKSCFVPDPPWFVNLIWIKRSLELRIETENLKCGRVLFFVPPAVAVATI